MDALNPDARWALDRFESTATEDPDWDEDRAVVAIHRFAVALDLPINEVLVVSTPDDALGLLQRFRTPVDSFQDLLRAKLAADFAEFTDPEKAAMHHAVARVIDHPICEALVAVRGGWGDGADVGSRRGDLVGVVFEVAAAIGARAAGLNADHVWICDQFQLAFECGLGWFGLLEDAVVAVPRPRMIMPDGRLHCVNGPAVSWPNGSAMYFLEGVEFDADVHARIVNLCITAEEALSAAGTEREVLLMQAAPAEDILVALRAAHVDTGMKGTRLYRVVGHFAPGRVDYCITMTDPSTGRMYLEWVPPDIGAVGDAELCQAHLFGIGLWDWLSLRVEG